MTVLLKGYIYEGLAVDVKPTVNVPTNTRFLETDTGSEYLWSGAAWVLQRFAMGRMPAGTSGQVLTAQGAGADPAYAAATKITSGTYDGNNTAHRAIPHGLGKVPKIIFIINGATYMWYRIQWGVDAIFYFNPTVQGTYSLIGEPNTTNFYVGDATSYTNSANATGEPYFWVAIG